MHLTNRPQDASADVGNEHRHKRRAMHVDAVIRRGRAIHRIAESVKQRRAATLSPRPDPTPRATNRALGWARLARQCSGVSSRSFAVSLPSLPPNGEAIPGRTTRVADHLKRPDRTLCARLVERAWHNAYNQQIVTPRREQQLVALEMGRLPALGAAATAPALNVVDRRPPLAATVCGGAATDALRGEPYWLNWRPQKV